MNNGHRVPTAVLLGALSFVGGAAPAQVALDVPALRGLYDSSFARIEETLPAGADSAPSPYWPLWAIARFRRDAVAWAELRGEQYFAVRAGPAPRAWLAIVPPDTPAAARMRGTMQLDPTATILVAQIALQPVTTEWAGIFLSRQLSLLADYALAATTIPVTDEQYYLSEFRGYQIELIAADLLARGRLRNAIDSLFTVAHVASLDRLAQLVGGLTPRDLRILDDSALSAPPRSDAERTLRNGFLAAALAVRYCEITCTSQEGMVATMHRVFPRAP
jgi:hypothetical protein